MKCALLLLAAFSVAAPLSAERVSVKRLEQPAGSDGGERQAPAGRAENHWTAERNAGSRSSGRVHVKPLSGGGRPARRTAVFRNEAVVRHIDRHRRVEVVPNRTYWHRVNGHRYGHTYRGGAHWYGFYDGPSFYWTRYHNSRWWWHDARHQRWVYWSNGNWWWPAPGGTVLVYLNDRYHSPSAAPESVDPPELASMGDGPEPENENRSWSSPDGSRSVQVFGPRSEGFLYDTSGSSSAYVGHLGQDVANVRYTGGRDGKPLQILVDYEAGSFALFSPDGRKVSESTR